MPYVSVLFYCHIGLFPISSPRVCQTGKTAQSARPWRVANLGVDQDSRVGSGAQDLRFPVNFAVMLLAKHENHWQRKPCGRTYLRLQMLIQRYAALAVGSSNVPGDWD